MFRDMRRWMHWVSRRGRMHWGVNCFRDRMRRSWYMLGYRYGMRRTRQMFRHRVSHRRTRDMLGNGMSWPWQVFSHGMCDRNCRSGNWNRNWNWNRVWHRHRNRLGMVWRRRGRNISRSCAAGQGNGKEHGLFRVHGGVNRYDGSQGWVDECEVKCKEKSDFRDDDVVGALLPDCPWLSAPGAPGFQSNHLHQEPFPKYRNEFFPLSNNATEKSRPVVALDQSCGCKTANPSANSRMQER